MYDRTQLHTSNYASCLESSSLASVQGHAVATSHPTATTENVPRRYKTFPGVGVQKALG